MEPPEEDDLAVEVVGLDVAGGASEALPGRPARARLSARRMELKQITSSDVFVALGRKVDAGRLQP